MKDILVKNSKIYTIILIVLLLNISLLYAQQKASAEFITEIQPMTLKTGEQIEDGIQRVMFHKNKLYVTNIWAGIQCVNVDDIKNPKIISTYETQHRPRNVFVSEKYCYVSDELGGVSILEVKKDIPTKIGQIKTTGDAFWVEAEYPYVYVAEEKSGVNVYDITDVSNPVQLGSYDTPGWAWYLTIKNNLVYVGDKNGGLQILDFSNKTNPVRVGQFQNLPDAKTVFIEDKYAYVANGPNGMAILDISNPKFPSLVSTYETAGYIFDLFKSGQNVFLADESNRRVDILNISNIKKPVLEGSYQAEGKVYSVWKKDIYLFVAADNKVLLLRHNNPPVLAAIENQLVPEEEKLIVTPSAADQDGDAIYYEVKNLPTGATMDSLSGIIRWTPTYEQSGVYKNITLTVIEDTDTKLSDTKSFSIDVKHVNRSPVMSQVRDTVVSENVTISFVVGEGTDPDKEDAGKLTYVAENLPEGAAFDGQTRTFSWTPTYEQSGVYTIDFVVNDPAVGSDRDACTLTVSHVDRKPVLTAVENKTIPENQLFSLKVEGSDPDIEDQNAISYRTEHLPEGAVFDAQTQIITWTPTYNQAGVYNDILLIMKAGNLSDSTKFNITVTHVNRLPILQPIADQVVDENKRLSYLITGSDDDVEDQGKLVYESVNLPEGAQFNSETLEFSWTPTYEQSGTYSDPTFIVTDPAGLSDSQSVKIVVNHINRAPLLEELQSISGNENIPISFSVIGSDADVEDAQKLEYKALSLPEGANFSDQKFSWTPTYDQSGIYKVEFVLSDGQLSDSHFVSLTIVHVNRPPKLDSLAVQTVDENKQLQFKLTASDPDIEDAGKFTVTAADLPEGTAFDQGTLSFTWTPTFEQSGEYNVTFTNTDPEGLTGKLKAVVKVNHINRTPVFNPILAQVVDENNLLTFVVPAGEDPDKEDTDKLVYSAKDLPEGATFDPVTRSITWTPTYDQSGEYTVVISLSDGEFTVVQPIKLTVNHINRAPVVDIIKPQNINENSQLQFSVNGNDPDKEDAGKTTLTVSTLPEGAVFDNKTGSFAWTPTYEQSGEYNVTFTLTDQAGLSTSQTATINVVHVNRPPVLSDIPSQSVAENTPVSFIVTASDDDKEDEGKLTFSSSNLPEGSMLDATSGSFTWNPNFLQAGNYNVNIKVTDSGSLSAEKQVTIDVSNVNRQPILNALDNKVVNENSLLTFKISGTDEDTDNEITFNLSTLPEGAEFNEKTGDFSWKPNYSQAGDYSFNVTMSDGESEVSSSFSVTVNNVNRKPEIEKGGSTTITIGETAKLSFSASDADEGTLTFSSDNLPDGSTLSSSGEFSWTPGDNQIGSFVFTVQVSDGTDTSQTSASVTVEAKPAPPPPPAPNQN